jgi:gamma-tubulin complex component 4
MDFETLLAHHTRYLAHVTSGLLLDPASAPLAAELGAILACAEALCGAVGRWGGDAVPALLAEGWGGEAVGDEVERRRAVIREIRG